MQIQAKVSRAVLTHCYGHTLNLAISDTIKQSRLCSDSMDTAFEINFPPNEMQYLTGLKLKFLEMKMAILWIFEHFVQLGGQLEVAPLQVLLRITIYCYKSGRDAWKQN